jgi:hypothetical protein
MTISHDLLRLKLAESLAAQPPALTRRDVRLPSILGKTFAVIGCAGAGRLCEVQGNVSALLGELLKPKGATSDGSSEE